jgi:holliday junction DNA helicase RuvA
MIGYLEGKIIDCDADGLLVLAGQVGYEVLVSPFTRQQVLSRSARGDEPVGLYIYFHVTERQPRPVLIGFATPSDKAFFQRFISVAAIGPIKAVKALIRPTAEIAGAIEEKQVAFLSKLPGIGTRTAEKIIATLHGKTREFAGAALPEATRDPAAILPLEKQQMVLQVTGVLVEQLGHSPASAQRMIQAAVEKNPGIQTPEALLDAIFQEGP